MKAIIPAAGKGTRMAEITGGAPKELLPVGGRSILARVVEEAREAGADEVVIVNSPAKTGIDAVAPSLKATVVYQPTMRGLAHALSMVPADSDALVLLGDCLYAGGSPLARMANLLRMGLDGAIAVETVPDEEVRRYGIVEVDGMGSITRFLEKPQPSETESRYAVAARYAFSQRFLDYLSGYVAHHLNRREGEINVTEVMAAAANEGFEFKAVALQPGQQRVDCGTPQDYIEARRLHWA